jgi:hypothetical protein
MDGLRPERFFIPGFCLFLVRPSLRHGNNMNTPIPQEEEEDLTIQLPSDLYIPILENINDRAVLAKVCLVDRLFLELARERLYEFVWVRPCKSRFYALICLVF